VNIVRKIISVPPHSKYASIITILHNMEDLSTRTSMLVIGNLVAFEMSWKMGQEEATSSSKSIALTCDEHKKMKGKKQVESSSSSSSSSEDEDEDDDGEEKSKDQASTSSSNVDEENIKLIEGVVKNIHKLNVKGVPISIKDILFTNQRRRQRKKGCSSCSKKGHFVEDCPNKPTPKTKKKACKAKALTTIKTWDDSSSEDEA
jgi:hypothetical protein